MTTTETNTADTAAIARRWSEEFWNGRLELLQELFTPDVADHNPLPGQSSGSDGQRQVVELFRAAFPDLRVRVDDLVLQGATVAVRWSAEGTHQGELFGIEPTGQSVSLHGIDIVRIDRGRISERWGEFDALGMLTQLGASVATT